MSASATYVSQPTPTATPLLITPAEISDPDIAIEYSKGLLKSQRDPLRQYEAGFEKGKAVPVWFPNGELGQLVTLGYAAPYRGVEFLYRIRDDQVEIVDIINGRGAWEEISFMELFPGGDGRMERVIKVEGRCCNGTGTVIDGYFELQRITDKGLVTIFRGKKHQHLYMMSGRTWDYEYAYEDWDGDGIKEIFEDIEICSWLLDQASRGYIKDVCTRERIMYFLVSDFANRQNMWYSHDPLSGWGVFGDELSRKQQQPLQTPAP